MKTIIRYFAKKYVAQVVNDILDSASRKTDLELWKQRVKRVIQFCQYILDSIEDNKLTEEETDKIIESATDLVK